jgi:hypothetical protein
MHFFLDDAVSACPPAKELSDSSCADNRNIENVDAEAKRLNVDCDSVYVRAGAPGTPIDL